MTYRNEAVKDTYLAWEAAIAEDPYRVEISRVKAAGGYVKQIAKLNAQANRASKTAAERYSIRIRNEAFKDIVQASDTPVIEKGFFEEFWGRGGAKVWSLLQDKLDREPQILLEFVPVVDGEFVLRGDLKSAAAELYPNSSGIILNKIVAYFGTEKGEYFLKDQGLEPDIFATTSSLVTEF